MQMFDEVKMDEIELAEMMADYMREICSEITDEEIEMMKEEEIQSDLLKDYYRSVKFW